jgi:hypothetical protein
MAKRRTIAARVGRFLVDAGVWERKYWQDNVLPYTSAETLMDFVRDMRRKERADAEETKAEAARKYADIWKACV